MSILEANKVTHFSTQDELLQEVYRLRDDAKRYSTLGALDPDELLDIASRMAQELQEICDDAIESGSSLPSTQALVDEYENDYFSKTNLSSKRSQE